MPWQCRRNTVLAEASTERDIRTPLDNRAQKNRQLERSVTIVTIEENDDVGRICRSQPRKARPSIPAARFLNDARPHSGGDLASSVIRVAVYNDDLCDQSRRQSCQNAPDRL